MSGCFEYPQYHHLTHEKFFKTIWKKVWKFLKSKYASSLSQFYMALVVFWMKFLTLNGSKKLFTHLPVTFNIFKIFSGPGLSRARWIECLRCVKRKLTLKKRRGCQILCSRRIFDRLWRNVIYFFCKIKKAKNTDRAISDQICDERTKFDILCAFCNVSLCLTHRKHSIQRALDSPGSGDWKIHKKFFRAI